MLSSFTSVTSLETWETIGSNRLFESLLVDLETQKSFHAAPRKNLRRSCTTLWHIKSRVKQSMLSGNIAAIRYFLTHPTSSV